MAQFRKEEIEIAGKERRAVGFMQVSQNLLLVVPFRSSNLKANLPVMDSPLLKLFGLISGDVVIQDDHAATFSSALTSLSKPCWTKRNASSTASGLMMLLY